MLQEQNFHRFSYTDYLPHRGLKDSAMLLFKLNVYSR